MDSPAAAPAPRVTEGDIAAAIVGEYYFTAADGVAGVQALEAGRHLSSGLALTGNLPDMCELAPVIVKAMPRLRDVTVCVLVLRNAFVVVGVSCPVSPENFDAEKGRKAARDNAVRQCWALLGYALRDRLHTETPRTPIWPQVAAAAIDDRRDQARTIIGDVRGDSDTAGFGSDEYRLGTPEVPAAVLVAMRDYHSDDNVRCMARELLEVRNG